MCKNGIATVPVQSSRHIFQRYLHRISILHADIQSYPLHSRLKWFIKINPSTRNFSGNSEQRNVPIPHNGPHHPQSILQKSQQKLYGFTASPSERNQHSDTTFNSFYCSQCVLLPEYLLVVKPWERDVQGRHVWILRGRSGKILECWVFKVLSPWKYRFHHHRHPCCHHRHLCSIHLPWYFWSQAKGTLFVLRHFVPHHRILYQHSIKHPLLLQPPLLLLRCGPTSTQLAHHSHLEYFLLADRNIYVCGDLPVDMIALDWSEYTNNIKCWGKPSNRAVKRHLKRP